LFLTLSTTVHPWYVLPMLALGVLYERPAWPWFWLGTFSIGTYLFYTDGPYWVWIILGWGGAAFLGLWLYATSLRALLKAGWVCLLRALGIGSFIQTNYTESR